MTDEQVRQLLMQMGKQPFQTRVAVCNAYDEEQKSIDASPLDGGADMFDVRIKAKIAQSGGIEIVPKIGSSVLLGIINNDTNQAFVILTSEVEKVLIESGTTVNLQGDSLGGLVKIEELKSQLSKTNQVVNALVQSLTGFVPVPNDGGSALKAFAGSQLTGKVVGDFSNIENEKVKHG